MIIGFKSPLAGKDVNNTANSVIPLKRVTAPEDLRIQAYSWI